MSELIEFIPEFYEALSVQLVADEMRWGDTWKNRPREGQEERILARLEAYADQYRNGDTPIPWLKIAGLCLIAMLREKGEQRNP